MTARWVIGRASYLTTSHRCAHNLAGREGPGKAFRLYREETFQSLPAATVPEIQRVSLASLMLQLKQLGIQNPQEFDFMDRCESVHRKCHTSMVTSHHKLSS